MVKCKFQFLGTGTADILWTKIRSMYPNLCWRSRTSNPVNKWYFDRADGSIKMKRDIEDHHYWTLFWYGPEFKLNKSDAPSNSIDCRGYDILSDMKSTSLAIPASFN